MNKLRKSFVLLLVLLVSTLAVAETTEEPVIGIVGRTDCGSFWRYDFNYETVDADGETPIVLSAAIFMTHDVHDKEIKAKGCGLINHYTITDDKSLPLEKIVKPAFFDEESEPMKDIVYHLKENSLVYDSWKPEKTDKITFYHSPSDEVVPFLNQESMERHLLDNGYTSFDIDDSSTEGHTDTGKLYVMYTALLLSEFVPTGMEDVFREIPREATHDIYSIDGRLIRKQTTLREALRSLPKGVYVINGRKMVKD